MLAVHFLLCSTEIKESFPIGLNSIAFSLKALSTMKDIDLLSSAREIQHQPFIQK